MIKYISILLLILIVSACVQTTGLQPDDIKAVKKAHQAYVDAWLQNDSAAVLATLTPDAILIPHHGVEPVIGIEAIRSFWFPPNSRPTRVTHMLNSVGEISGTGDLAIVWGRNEIEFIYENKTYKNQGNYLSVLRKGPNGIWLICKRIWNDPVPNFN